MTRYQIRVLALPSESAAGGEWFFHDGGGIDEDLHVTTGIYREPACQFFQT